MISNRYKAPNLLVTFLFVGVLFLIAAGMVFAASGGGHGEEGGGWAVTDTYRVINFVVLVGILIYFLRTPVKQFFSDRVRVIREQLEDLESQKQEAEKKLEEYNERLAALSQESENIIEQYRRQGENLRDKIMKEAESAAKKLEDQARKNIEHEFAQAKLKLETEVFDKAVEKAEQKLKRVITDNDQEKLVKEYLDKVVTK
ncbi:MAG: F0F1 ATP synthase subunit B [Desulfobacteraceae bacterium]|nr:F0F1 ATP synthase subunit B [Desulfobacteraceae bacterium]MCF8094034.1 F0F1 ATP synthase subunit B [Desulfobacteraceae bacterium]